MDFLRLSVRVCISCPSLHQTLCYTAPPVNWTTTSITSSAALTSSPPSNKAMPPIPPLFTLPIQPNGRITWYVLPYLFPSSPVKQVEVQWWESSNCDSTPRYISPRSGPELKTSILTTYLDHHSTQPSTRLYLLTFESPPDNRLTPSFCHSLLLALDILDHRFPKGVVVTTSGIPKFYSNGLDYESAVKEGEKFWRESLYPLWRRLLT